MSDEIHYIAYDPEEIWMRMQRAYIAAGGDVLYPGDEKEMLLRGVQLYMMQELARVDEALRMATLRYAVGEYLDLYGEGRECARIAEQAAESRVQIDFGDSGWSGTIETGAVLTADGEILWALAEDVRVAAGERQAEARIVCQTAGAAGNQLTAGTQMQFLKTLPGVQSVVAVEDAVNGQDEETDDAYRERIHVYGTSSTTAGPEQQYEKIAMGVSSQIIDARALRVADGVVGVYLILEEGANAQNLIERVDEALNPRDTRPLTDRVQVQIAEERPYVLRVRYAQEVGDNIREAVEAATAEYQHWQDDVIGRAFNPDKLMAMLYQAGATRVIWDEASGFDGGGVEYTPIEEDERCTGTITLAVMSR